MRHYLNEGNNQFVFFLIVRLTSNFIKDLDNKKVYVTFHTEIYSKVKVHFKEKVSIRPFYSPLIFKEKNIYMKVQTLSIIDN